MSKRNKKNKNRNIDKRRSSEKLTSPKNGESPKELSLCLNCGHSLIRDKVITGLAYCPKCSLFFLTPHATASKITLDEAFVALRQISGSDILFSDRIAGIISAIIPNVEEGILTVLRKISEPGMKNLTEALKNEDELDHIEILLLIRRTGLSYEYVLIVFNALRKALNKPVIEEDYLNISSYQKIITKLSSQGKEAFPGEKIKIEWEAIDKPLFTYILNIGNNATRVKSTGFTWITVDRPQIISLKAFYKRHNEVESKTISIGISSPPIIKNFSCNISSPVLETEKIKVTWEISNAEKVTLIHHYNDYEQLSVDISSNQNEFSFVALRSELLELVISYRTRKVSKSIMIDVMPLPRFNVNKIPQLTGFPDLEMTRVLLPNDSSEMEKLYTLLKNMISLSNSKPYLSFRENMTNLSHYLTKFFKE